MADTIRQQIISAVDTQLKTILTANGYYTDVGANVNWWKGNAFEGSALPAINCRDRIEEIDEGISTFGSDGFNLQIEITVALEGSTSIAEMRKAVNDIIAAVREDDTWSGLAVYSEIGGSEAALEQQENVESAVMMVLNIHYQASFG